MYVAGKFGTAGVSEVADTNPGDTATVGSTTLTSFGLTDWYVAKLDAAGNWIWAISGGSEAADEPYGLAVSADGSAVYASGVFSLSVPHLPFTATFGDVVGAYRAGLFKIDGSTGAVVWGTHLHGNTALQQKIAEIALKGSSLYVAATFAGKDATVAFCNVFGTQHPYRYNRGYTGEFYSTWNNMDICTVLLYAAPCVNGAEHYINEQYCNFEVNMGVAKLDTLTGIWEWGVSAYTSNVMSTSDIRSLALDKDENVALTWEANDCRDANMKAVLRVYPSQETVSYSCNNPDAQLSSLNTYTAILRKSGEIVNLMQLPSNKWIVKTSFAANGPLAALGATASGFFLTGNMRSEQSGTTYGIPPSYTGTDVRTSDGTVDLSIIGLGTITPMNSYLPFIAKISAVTGLFEWLHLVPTSSTVWTSSITGEGVAVAPDDHGGLVLLAQFSHGAAAGPPIITDRGAGWEQWLGRFDLATQAWDWGLVLSRREGFTPPRAATWIYYNTDLVGQHDVKVWNKGAIFKLADGSLRIPGFITNIQEATGPFSMTLGDGSTVDATGYTPVSPAYQVNKLMFVLQIS